MEFDKEWAEVGKNYDIEKHSWVIETYRKRQMWPNRISAGNFLLESMNAYFNRFLKRGLRLYEFVAHFDRGVNLLRLKDVEAKVVNDNSFPVMETTLMSLERRGAEVFSRAIFVKFQEEIVVESCLFLLEKQETEDHYMYKVGKYGAPKKVWTVEYKPCNGIMKCSCLKVESVGIPCRHMISVMKREQLRQIPPGCVLLRWMRPTMQDGHQVSYYASHLDKEFDEVRKVALQMMCQVNWAYKANGKKLHCRGVKDECMKEEFMNQSQMKRSTNGGSGMGIVVVEWKY
ncbi:hypothetical protein Vadar_004665 [Vaccinium darrowii]|uniref:Uncharacterized protein n=1 Tax=Vaccinium darrowii TaxID=229202 RepID=A0ACB7YCR1_9ERIC|nr:hypothetical protein Vadar_004665 [Vaccinium darrowii]